MGAMHYSYVRTPRIKYEVRKMHHQGTVIGAPVIAKSLSFAAARKLADRLARKNNIDRDGSVAYQICQMRTRTVEHGITRDNWLFGPNSWKRDTNR